MCDVSMGREGGRSHGRAAACTPLRAGQLSDSTGEGFHLRHTPTAPSPLLPCQKQPPQGQAPLSSLPKVDLYKGDSSHPATPAPWPHVGSPLPAHIPAARQAALAKPHVSPPGLRQPLCQKARRQSTSGASGGGNLCVSSRLAGSRAGRSFSLTRLLLGLCAGKKSSRLSHALRHILMN